MNKKECLGALDNLKIPTDNWDSLELQLAENNEEPIEYKNKESIDILQNLIDQYFEPKPYEFEDLKVGMWVYDTKPTFGDFRFIKITKILSKEDCKYLYNDENVQVFFDNQIEHARDFEEGRYFPITKAMEE